MISSGRYEDGSSGGLFPVGRSQEGYKDLSTYLCVGNIPLHRFIFALHTLKVFLNISGTFRTAVFIAKPGTSSSPGDFLMEIFLAAIFTSVSATYFSSTSVFSVRPAPACRSRCSGNKCWATLSRKVKQDGALVPLGLILFTTVRYRPPHRY